MKKPFVNKLSDSNCDNNQKLKLGQKNTKNCAGTKKNQIVKKNYINIFF